MIDLHAHLLPGLDDGPATTAAALELAAAMAAAGVHTVVAGPHANDLYNTAAAAVLSGVAALKDQCRQAGINIDILPGMELLLLPDLPARLRRGEALTIANTKYVCVELPPGEFPHYTERGMFDLLMAGYRPILNHPERNRGIQRGPQRCQRLYDMGVQFMITAGSLTGRFGPTCQTIGKRLIQEGLATLIVTDAHNVTTRPPELKAALEIAATLGKSNQQAEAEILGLAPGDAAC